MDNSALRVAGWATLGFSIAYFVTFIVNTLMSLANTGPDYPTAPEMAADVSTGIVFMLLWGAAGAAVVVAAVALPAVVWPVDGLLARIATAFGVIAGAGWILSGVFAFAQRTSLLNDNIAAAGADAAAERAIVEALYIGVHASGVLFAFAAVPWLAIVAVGAARRRAMPKLAIVFLWIAAVLPLGGFVATGLQVGLLGVLVAFAVVGASLLGHARRSRNAASAPSSSADAGAPAA